MRELLIVALILACPLMMMLMMRGGGHGHAGHAHEPRAGDSPELSTASLRRLRADVDSLIAERELDEERAAGETKVLGGTER